MSKRKFIHTAHRPTLNRTPVNVDSIEAMNQEKDKMVTGTFVNLEFQGQPAKVCGKFYKEMQYFSRVFEDGEKATIPLSVARFINERCSYEVHTFLQDETGKPIKHPVPRSRYKFIVESYAA